VIKNYLINFFLLVSLIGILDAGYLTISHLGGKDAGCFLLEGCNIVLKSSYAEIFGIPIALFGLAYYLVIFLGILFFNFNRKRILIRNISILTIFGLLATLWFLYLQAFVIREFCTYCLISAVTSGVLFGLGMYVLKVLYKDLPSITTE
jgi:uncharacterized membrane protein